MKMVLQILSGISMFFTYFYLPFLVAYHNRNHRLGITADETTVYNRDQLHKEQMT